MRAAAGGATHGNSGESVSVADSVGQSPSRAAEVAMLYAKKRKGGAVDATKAMAEVRSELKLRFNSANLATAVDIVDSLNVPAMELELSNLRAQIGAQEAVPDALVVHGAAPNALVAALTPVQGQARDADLATVRSERDMAKARCARIEEELAKRESTIKKLSAALHAAVSS